MFKIKFGSKVKQYLVIIIANFSILQLGVSVAWVSPVTVKLRDENQTIFPNIVTEEEISWIASVTPLAGISIFFISGFLADYFGRKICLLIVSIPRFLMFLLPLVATDAWMIIFGRAIGGIADAMTMTVLPTFVSEIASKEIRGALGTITQITSAVGMMIMLTIGPYVSYFAINLICIGIVFGFTIPMFLLPESPYHLYRIGRQQEALKVLSNLRDSEALAQDELDEYDKIPNLKLSYSEMIKDKTVIKALLMVLVLTSGLMFGGYNAVMFYLQTILESTQTSISPEISSVIIGCVQVLACFCTIVFVERFGRKPILTSTLILMALGMVGLGVFFWLMEGGYEITGFLNFLPLISMVMVIFFHNAGMGSLIWMVIAELFDGPTRAFGVSIGVVLAFIFLFLLTKYFAAVTITIGAATTYWIFSGVCIFMCLFIFFIVPETKGKTFNEIQTALGRKEKDVVINENEKL